MTLTKKFLLVEDDPADVELMQNELNSVEAYMQLRFVEDGIEAVQYMMGRGRYADRHRFPLPDVILLDLKLPRLDGFQFLEWLRKEAAAEQRFIPVIVISGVRDSETVARAYASGGNAFLSKAVDWKEFRKKIVALGTFWAAHAETPYSDSNTTAGDLLSVG